MRARTTLRAASLVGAVALVSWSLGGPAAADGTILTTGASILSGSNTNDVTIDPAAPVVPLPTLPAVGTIPAQGTFTGTLPGLPSTGDGSDGAFSTTTDMLGLAGGTYQYTSYEIRNGASVSYTGAVTLRVQGDVTIEGRLDSFSSGESITIISGGSIHVLATGGGPVTGVRTQGGSSPVQLEAAEMVEIGATGVPIGGMVPEFQCEVRADFGDVMIRAHGTGVVSGVDIFDASLGGDNSPTSLMIGAADFVTIAASRLRSRFGDTRVQAFGGSLQIDSTDVLSTVGNMFLEAASGVELVNGSTAEARAADLSCHAFGGDVTISGISGLAADDGTSIGVAAVGDGTVDVSASGSVTFSDVGVVETFGSGGIHVTAHGGSVLLEPQTTTDASYLREDRDGEIVVRAQEDVFLGGFSSFEANDGPVEVRALSEFVQEGETYVSSNTGAVDARAGDAIAATTFLVEATSAPNPYFSGGSILLVAGPGGIDLEVDFLDATDGTLDVLARGDVRISAINFVQSYEDLTVRSLDGSIDVSGTTTRTVASANAAAILIESFGGDSAVIDATDATIFTDDGGAFIAGPVSLIIHASGAAQIDSFVLPKTVKLRANAKKPEKSSLRVAGFFDTGIEQEALAGAATVTIGDTEITANLVPKGRNFTLQNDQLKLVIKPARSGSSRAKFALQLKGDVAGLIDPEGRLDLRFSTASADGSGAVVLQKGAYKLGKKAGLLVAPSLFPSKLKATHKGAGKDALAFQAGLATEGGPPSTIGDVTIRYGDTLVVTVPGSEFQKKGDNFIAKSPPSAPQIAKLNVNFVREKIDLVAKGLDLGPLPAEAGPVTLGVTIGDVESSVAVRVAPVAKRGQAKY